MVSFYIQTRSEPIINRNKNETTKLKNLRLLLLKVLSNCGVCHHLSRFIRHIFAICSRVIPEWGFDYICREQYKYLRLVRIGVFYCHDKIKVVKSNSIKVFK